jgi:hypothetical protein
MVTELYERRGSEIKPGHVRCRACLRQMRRHALAMAAHGKKHVAAGEATTELDLSSDHGPRTVYMLAPLRSGADVSAEAVAAQHAAADAACGRDWITGGCTCGACVVVREAKHGVPNPRR